MLHVLRLAVNYLPEILKIIEAGMTSDPRKVRSYATMLAKKLEKQGDSKSAARVQKITDAGVGNKGLSPARNGQGDVPIDRDSRLSLADESYPSRCEVSVQLQPVIEKKIDEFLGFVKASDRLMEAGVGVSPSMLIFGPPGCGKTYLAQHIAAQLELPLLTTRCDTVMSSFFGSTAKNLRRIFDHAASRPCVLFLDEFDALAKARDDQHEVGELKRVVVGLLQNIDTLPPETILLAATNHEKLLDPAVWRRFAYQIQLDNPTEEVRERLVRQYLGDFCPKSVQSIVRLTDGISGAVIRQICEASIRAAVVVGDSHVTEQRVLGMLAHIQYADVIQSSASTPEKMRILRKDNPKVFTTRMLGDMFDVSIGKVSKLINS